MVLEPESLSKVFQMQFQKEGDTMQQKKRKTFRLHSIPINLCKKLSSAIRFPSGRVAPARRRGCGALDLLVSPDSFGKGINGTKLHNKHEKYLVSYSIPLSCMVVLLLGLGLMVSPDLLVANKSSAVEMGEDTVELDEVMMDNTASNPDDGIMLTAATTSIGIGVSASTGDGYGNTATGQVTTAPGAGTAYRSHKINVTGSNIMSYELKISGPANLTPSSGASTTVSGAGGKTGEQMGTSGSNIWGYAWGQNADDVAEMTYNSMSTSGATLSCDSPSSYNVNCERKLVFGANFNAAANPGTYTANVTLSLTATPAEVAYSLVYNANGGSNAPSTQMKDSVAASETFTISNKGSMAKTGYEFLGWSTSSSATSANATYAPGKTVTLQKSSPSLTLYAVWKAITLDAITNMQDMTPAICQNASAGATATLKDSRDNNTYTIIKQSKDNKCWMQQNLRLSGSRTLTPSDSNVSSNWTLPATQASSASTWTSDNTAVMSRTGTTEYGNYYTWITTTTTPVKGVELFIEKIGGLGIGSNLKLPINPARSSRRPRFNQSAQVNNLIGEYYHCTDDRITSQCAGSA